jgi:hypothetical protein
MVPDTRYDDRKDNSPRPSWTGNRDFINDEHRGIFAATKNIPGWQMEGDTYKLYEMGYFAGDVILEIGTYGGRSAVVELAGALKSFPKPQFFGIDVNRKMIRSTHKTLCRFNMSEHALLYHGTLQTFMREVSIEPTMCFVDGDHRYEGVKRDLYSLSELLRPGVPVLCHDYLNPENDTGAYGIRKAANEWEEKGYAEFYGVFGCSALFVTSEKCRGRKADYSEESFSELRETLMRTYRLRPRPPADQESRLKRFIGKIVGAKR